MRDLPRPFLKWAVGKSRLLPALSSRIPGEFGTYYEPFLSGGAHFFHLAAARVHVLLSNSDTEMVHEIYAGLPCDEVKVARSINSRASRRGGVGELILRGGPLVS